ncbi:N-acetyl sugar amidotransferase [Chitinophaga sp. NPDC101104]|uniref:N-acetyl sugar amidotransferase n=1 Tax=Chitinophaga sp. NPDC101104 TaxID=3390561 RepID=UPI003D055C32
MKAYRICTNCVMDTSDPDITFDDNGKCNHCHKYEQSLVDRVFDPETAKVKLEQLVTQVKAHGKGKDYDCLIGVSGGVDSTYVAYLVKTLGLRPLAVHLDNGWNSELAVKNIENVLTKMNIDLYTYVINWEEFRSLQLAFLKASTPDGEIPSDHAIFALLFKEAKKRGIKHIITGMNYRTESILPKSWAQGHLDWRYVKSVNKQFGRKPLRTFPHITIGNLFYAWGIKRTKYISILNYIDYKKTEVMRVLQDELGWKYYGGKHYESVYTRFYQSYVLPEKFNIDKRRAHLSNLILSGQVTRDEALEELKKPTCDPKIIAEDIEFTTKKLQISRQEFDEIMKLPVKSYQDYPNLEYWIQLMRKGVNLLRSKGLFSK